MIKKTLLTISLLGGGIILFWSEPSSSEDQARPIIILSNDAPEQILNTENQTSTDQQPAADQSTEEVITSDAPEQQATDTQPTPTPEQAQPAEEFIVETQDPHTLSAQPTPSANDTTTAAPEVVSVVV